MWRTPATLRRDSQGHTQPRSGMQRVLRPDAPPLPPPAETSCDDTCAAVLSRTGEMRSNVISSQRVHERFGGVVPEIASRKHLELVNPVVDQALTRRRTLEESSSSPPRRGRDWSERCSSASPRPRRSPRPRAAVRGGRPSAGARRRELPRADEPRVDFEPPFVCLIASGGHTLLATCAERDGLRSARPDARRRRRRGVRQGREDARPGLPGRSGARAPRRRGGSEALGVPRLARGSGTARGGPRRQALRRASISRSPG